MCNVKHDQSIKRASCCPSICFHQVTHMRGTRLITVIGSNLSNIKKKIYLKGLARKKIFVSHNSIIMATNENLPPSAQLALLHAQQAASSSSVEEDPFVPSPDDPVLDSPHFEPLIAGDYPTPIGKPIITAPKKEVVDKKKLDLNSESAFPSLSASPRTPVSSGGWSSAAASRVKAARPMAPPASGNTANKKSSATQITDVFKLSASSQIANMPNKPLGFKSNADVIQQVIKKTGTNIIASTNRSGTTTFIIQGTPNDVAKAKKELIAGLVVKVSV